MNAVMDVTTNVQTVADRLPVTGSSKVLSAHYLHWVVIDH